MNDDIARAVAILRAGGLVAFPTETVYGLAADASSASAIARLYTVKGRPPGHPVIVHFAEARRAFSWAASVPDHAARLAEAFWPGPITLVLARAGHVGDFVTGGQRSVGLRVPRHPVAQALLKAFDDDPRADRCAGVAAPSANRFGRVSPTSAAHVREDLGTDVDLVLDGGDCEVGIESTIVDCTRDRPSVLRPGAITAADIERVVRVVSVGERPFAPRVPGSLPSHYAPRTPVRLVATHELDAAISEAAGAVAVLAFSRPDERARIWRRMPRDAAGYAHRLYEALRALDHAGCPLMLVEVPPADDAWAAVRDRLSRAAGAA